MDCNFTLCKRYLNGNCIKQVGEKCQLEQAKEIIQKAVFQNICYNCDFGINHCSQCRNGTLRKQAEQFLKEIKENKGYFVIKYKNEDKYVSDSHPYCLPPYKTQFIDNAKSFKTRTKAYKYMRENCLDKECIVKDVIY